MDIPVQHRLVHRVEVEVLLVVQARQHLAVLNVQTQMELLQIHVRVGVVPEHLAQHQMGYFVNMQTMSEPVQNLEVLTAEEHLAVHNVRTKMDLLQIHVLVGVVRHIARHQKVYFVNMQTV